MLWDPIEGGTVAGRSGGSTVQGSNLGVRRAGEGAPLNAGGAEEDMPIPRRASSTLRRVPRGMAPAQILAACGNLATLAQTHCIMISVGANGILIRGSEL
jgi:hypothetical protein